MPNRVITRILGSGVWFAVLLLYSSAARAEAGGRIDVDLDLGASMANDSLTVGGGARFGWRFDLGPVWLQPEAGGHYTLLTTIGCDSCQRSLASDGTHAIRVLGGARLGGRGLISGVIEPSIFGHAGYGWLKAADLDLAGPAFDVGLALDVKLVRYFRFGVHGAYNVVTPTHGSDETVLSEKWISVGLHLGAAF